MELWSIGSWLWLLFLSVAHWWLCLALICFSICAESPAQGAASLLCCHQLLGGTRHLSQLCRLLLLGQLQPTGTKSGAVGKWQGSFWATKTARSRSAKLPARCPFPGTGFRQVAELAPNWGCAQHRAPITSVFRAVHAQLPARRMKRPGTCFPSC